MNFHSIITLAFIKISASISKGFEKVSSQRPHREHLMITLKHNTQYNVEIYTMVITTFFFYSRTIKFSECNKTRAT